MSGRHAGATVAVPACCLYRLCCPCRKGEELTISYGAWPNEVFFLFFGFLPEHNPFDAVVLYHDLDDLILHYVSIQVRLAPLAIIWCGGTDVKVLR